MNKLMKLLMSALFAVAFSASAHALWGGATDNVYSNAVPLTTGQVTVTDVTVSTSATTTIAANGSRVHWYGCIVDGSTGDLFYDVGTVSVTLSPYVLAGTEDADDGETRCFTVNKGGINWQGAIQLKAVTAGVAIRHYEFTK